MSDKAPDFVPLTKEQLPCAIEAILFAAGYPVEGEKLASVLHVRIEEIKEAAEHLAQSYANRGIQMICLGTRYQLCTREEHEDLIRDALGIKGGGTLSPSMTEVLAIIAYHQPVTRAFIEQVRGVDCSYAINMLGEKHMIECVGRLEVPGRPMLYATTDDFLRAFGLESLTQLPETTLPEPLAEGEGAGSPLPEPQTEDEGIDSPFPEPAPGATKEV